MVCNEGTAVRLRNQIVSKVVNLFTLETKINCLLLVFTIKEGKSGTSLIAQLVKNLPAMQETWFNFWAGKIRWRRGRLHTPVFLGFPCGSAGKAAMRETWVRSLGWEDPLEKRKATHSSILAWRIPWTVESMGRKE